MKGGYGRMTDRERLEEIEVKYSILTVSSEKNGMEYTEVDIEDLVFLMQNSFKQAERVRELEETNKKNYWIAADFKIENLKLEQQNKRYREALEFYADEEVYKENLITKAEYDADGICISNDEYAPPIIYFDNGEKARQALKGE